MDISILEDIGLTGAEMKVFVSLLEVGCSTAGAIVEKSGLQNAVVHRAFHSLIQKGLVTFIYEGRIRVYQAIDPKGLLHFLDEKRAKLASIIPFLESKKLSANARAKATTFQGVRGVKECILGLLDSPGKSWLTYGGPKQAHTLFGDFFWENIHRQRAKSGIKARLIFHDSLQWWADELNKNFNHTTVRTTKTNIEEVTETIIRDDRVVMILYLDNPIAFRIDAKQAAMSYATFFEFLWNASE